MADKVALDAMVRRADFAIGSPDTVTTDQISTLSVESLGKQSMITAMLRKPDFQRETNHWTPVQLISFLESFLDHELIPSVILWRSPAHVFVIDGGHRLSALRAWIEDDYGDGPLSRAFYNNEISTDQARVAIKTRKLVDEKVGSYIKIKDALVNPDVYSTLEVARARNMATRSLSLQWVVGDAEKAETSFFKINTQGTPLDSTEEFLLRNRKRSVAIAARATIRAATGHKYWSKFEAENSNRIEEISKKVHELIFKPEIIEPIKTLSLPVGGKAAPLAAIDLLIKLIIQTNASQSKPKPIVEDFAVDVDGSETIKVLLQSEKVMSRLTGNSHGSLGLHPAIYFYTDKGRHSADMLMGWAHLISMKLANNDSGFFQKFTSARRLIEEFLIVQKPIMGVLLQAVSSRQRVERMSEFFDAMVKKVEIGEALTTEWAIEIIAPNSRTKIMLSAEEAAGKTFSNDTKSAIYIKESLEGAMKCPICDGYLEASSSVSYDHVERVREGGLGTADNGRLTHPFCNTGVKN